MHDFTLSIQPLENQKQSDLYGFNNYPIGLYYFAPDRVHWMSLQQKLDQLKISTNNCNSIEGQEQQK